MTARHHTRSFTRRAIARVLGPTLVVLGLGGVAAWQIVEKTTADAQTAPPSAPPSIVFILTDDQRADQVAAMPSVSSLAASGITFDNAYVSNPLCCPSRATILSGRYSHGTRVYRNESSRPLGGWAAFRDDESSTVATWLRAAGYRTALVGKYMNGYGGGGAVPPGWSDWFAYVGAPGYYDYRVTDNGQVRSFGSDAASYGTDVLARRAVNVIRSTPKNTPLFLYFAPYAPHAPGTPPKRHTNTIAADSTWHPGNFNEADVTDKPAWMRGLARKSPAAIAAIDADRARQAESLLAVDDAVRAIREALRDTGRLGNTMIVFTSDNGAQGGSHRLVAKQAPYQESVHVPLVVRYDPLTKARAGLRSTALIGNIDFAPTFAALASTAAPKAEGRSFLGRLAGDSTRWRKYFLLEHLQNASNPVPTYCGVVTRRHKLVEYATGETELYDLLQDPLELRNRAGETPYADVERTLHDRLLRMCSPPPPGMFR
jgi:arylsulfatase A-like enzyme